MPKVLPATTGSARVNPKAFANTLTKQQAAALTPKPEGETVIAKIRDAMYGAFDAVSGNLHDALEVAERAEAVATEGGNLRAKLLQGLAKASIAGGFTADQITEACKDVAESWVKAKGSNLTPKSLTQFVSECRKCMHPASRESVTDAFRIAKRDWAAERKAFAADSEAPQPLKERFKKEYHMALTMVDALIPKGKEGVAVDHEIAMDPHALAETRETQQRGDGKIAYRIVEKALKALSAVAEQFPDAELAEAIDALSGVTPDTLNGARRKAMRAERRETREPRPVPTRAAKGGLPRGITAKDILADDAEAAADELLDE